MAKIPLLQSVMGKKFEQLKGPVKTHFSLTPDDEASIILQGHMEQVWHPGWLTGPMWVGSLLGVLFPETGQNVPTYITIQTQGLRQQWHRTFEFARRRRTFSDAMVLDQAKNRILNFFGANDRFAMVFHFVPLANGGLEIIGGQQYLNFGRTRLPVPRMLTPALITQEWPVSEDKIAMELRIHHPLVGQIYTYRGQFTVTKRST
jgi:hypothetical protein